jgi:hypothetical protein
MLSDHKSHQVAAEDGPTDTLLGFVTTWRSTVSHLVTASVFRDTGLEPRPPAGCRVEEPPC